MEKINAVIAPKMPEVIYCVQEFSKDNISYPLEPQLSGSHLSGFSVNQTTEMTALRVVTVLLG